MFSYLQTLQVRLRHGTLAVSGFTALLEIASKLAACDTLREGPSAPPAAEKFPPSQIPDFWETWKRANGKRKKKWKRRMENRRNELDLFNREIEFFQRSCIYIYTYIHTRNIYKKKERVGHRR